jgi:hypothetical protein
LGTRCGRRAGGGALTFLAFNDRWFPTNRLYWRIHETRLSKRDFKERLREDSDAVYGKYVRPLSFLGLLIEDEEDITLTDWVRTGYMRCRTSYLSTTAASCWARLRRIPGPAKSCFRVAQIPPHKA